ncbi:actin cytoskeleton-regulatory complex protein PAN1-like isoform X2 [Thrips palmi]|uniref:Actin cytoskeleton-regulatory complex protein PAN1-like isoform X2 n=1 Tax=Thrips palmi TaxID=161013 RepID=A0A6P8YGI6_THRPL|nr:actin cytoskeleton-regulatory complex protein PAN1-like isoform X2 [Thrips palmi]
MEEGATPARKAKGGGGQNDHEYEPVSPPPGPAVAGPPTVHVTNIEGITIQEPPEGPDAEPIMSETDSAGSPVRRPVDEVPVPHDGDDEDRAMSGGEMGDTNGSLGGADDEMEHEDDEFITAAQIQQQMEDRFFAPTPTTMRAESRTPDAAPSTAYAAAPSGADAAPQAKKGRGKNKKLFMAGSAQGRWGRLRGTGQSSAGTASSGSPADGSQPETIQQRLRSGADRLKTRLAGMPRPKLPAVRKPKFTMPDKSKFHLPDRPKFKMPERPKFKMPDRPKISLGSLGRGVRGSASTAAASEATTATSGTASGTADGSSEPQQPKKAGKRSLKAKAMAMRSGRQYSTESTAGSSEKRRPLFDLNTFRTYPRMLTRKIRGGDSSSSPRSARSTRPGTPPPRASFSNDTVKWMRRFSEAKYGAGDPQAAAVNYAAHHTPPPTNNRHTEPPAQASAAQAQQSSQPASTRNGEQMVYHISLHGTDSEPEYSDDQFQGPPYPELLPIDGDLEIVDHAARKALEEAKAAAAEEAALEAKREARREAKREAQRLADIEAVRRAEAAEEAQMEREYRRRTQQQQQQQGRSLRFGRYAADSMDADEEQDYSQDQDYSQEQDVGDSDRENRSSGTSSERHRRGVIEEIDSDEFFLRQKGISQEDVDVGRYIASEIREALRPGAAAGYGLDDEDEESVAVPSPPPPRPQRGTGTRSLARKKKQGKIYVPARAPARATPPADEDDEEWDDEEDGRVPADDSYFNTFPPDRPARRRRAKKPVPPTPPPRHEQDDEDSRIQEDIDLSVAIHRDDLGILAQTPAADEQAVAAQPPMPPKRLRKSKSSNLNLHDDVPMIDDAEEDWGRAERRAEREEVLALQQEADYIVPRAAPDGQQQPPVPPTRGRKSRGGSRVGSRAGSRGTSLADEDRTSRGAESLPSERDGDELLPEDSLLEDVLTRNEDDDDVRLGARIDDYAFVDKQSLPRGVAPPKPDRPRRPKPPRPPAPGRRAKRAPTQSATARLQNWRQFFSLPTRRSAKQAAKQATVAATPVRPARNYSTLGPARPPRRGSHGSQGSRHSPLPGTVYTAGYLEIHADDAALQQRRDTPELDNETESSRADLQSGDVISRMKDRPLPAPPRPTRARKHYDKGDLDMEVDEQFQEKTVPDRYHYPDDGADASRDFTDVERKAAMAQLREDFFSRSGEEAPETAADAHQDQWHADGMQIPTVIMTEPPADEPLPDSPYKSLRKKKKKIPPLPPPEPEPEEDAEPERPEEVSIAIQTDPLPDDLCVEDAAAAGEDREDTTTSASRTWPTVMEQRQEAPPPPPPPTRRPRRDSHEPTATAAAAAAAAAVAAAIPASVKLDVPESLQTQRLQVSDLDVNRLSVNELRANKITVSEIDGMSLSVSEVHNRSSSGLQLAPGEPGTVELPSDLLQQLLPLSQSMSHALSQSLSESLASSLSQALSQIQEALSQPAELVQQQQLLQEQLHRLQELQSQQQQQQSEQLQQQQQFQQQQQQLAQDTLLQVEQQHSAVLHELQQQLQSLQLAAATHPDVPPPIPPPPRVDAQSIQTQTSLELPVGAAPATTATALTAPVAPPRGGARPRVSPAALGVDSEEDEEVALAMAPHSSHSLPRRRRHHGHSQGHSHRASARYSSDDDEEHLAPAPRRHRPASALTPTASTAGDGAVPSLGEAGRQLARACRVSAIHALATLHQAIQPAMDSVGQAVGADPKRRDLQAALCLVLVLVTALILLGCGCAGSKVVHHHHWDFQFPPPL